MSDVKNLCDRVCGEIHFQRQSYESPTKILRQCSHLHCKGKLKDIWAMECLPQPCGPWTSGNSPNRPWANRGSLALQKSYDNPTTKTRASSCHLGPSSESVHQWLATSCLTTSLWYQHNCYIEESRAHPSSEPYWYFSNEDPTKILRHCGFPNE